MKNLIKTAIANALEPLAQFCDKLLQMIQNTDIKTRSSIIIGMLLVGLVFLIFSKLFFGLWAIACISVFFNWPRTIQNWIRIL